MNPTMLGSDHYMPTSSVSHHRIAAKLGSLPEYPFAAHARKIGEVVAEGHDVIRLDVGNPDLPPHDQVIQALVSAVRQDDTHGYGGYRGIPRLREAFAAYYGRRFNVELDPDREVLPLIGSKDGITHIALALLDPGDIVLVPDPGYPAYARSTLLAGATPYPMKLDRARGFFPRLDALPVDVLKRARMLWVNYPHNPTTATATREQLQEVVQFCLEHSILLCSDNPYADVVFGEFKPPSVLEIEGAREIAVEFYSLSKTFNMAGWRVGASVGNARLIEALLQVKSNVDSGMFIPVQEAACIALEKVPRAWIEQRNAVYRQRRDTLLDALPGVGLLPQKSPATMYVWARVQGGDDLKYAEDALQAAHVSIAPGRFFGEGGRGYVRISLVVDDNRMQEAVARLRRWYQSA
jgi:LL-diaminopimelate aminotransferase